MTTPDPTALVASSDADRASLEDARKWVLDVRDEVGPVSGYWYDLLGLAAKNIAVVLAAHPPLRAALELGLAWEAAVKALPEGWLWEVRSRNSDDDDYMEPHVPGEVIASALSAECWGAEGYDHEDEYAIAGGPTPAVALQALAARLTEGTRP